MKNTKKYTIEELFEKFGKKREHAEQVKKNASMLFDAVNGVVINLSPKAKEYLLAAAYLHDIGYFIDKKSHHKHTMDLILQYGIDGYEEEEETKIIANIARYHRSSFPNIEEHKEFASLKSQNRDLVQKLASILRIADGLDKPEKNLILQIYAENTHENIVFTVKSIGFKPKLISAQEKSDLFELTFNKKVSFILQ